VKGTLRKLHGHLSTAGLGRIIFQELGRGKFSKKKPGIFRVFFLRICPYLILEI